MTSGQHRSHAKSPAPSLVPVILGVLSIPAGLILVVVAVTLLLRYSPYDDPGMLPAGAWTLAAGLFLAGLPVAYVILRAALHEISVFHAWKATLTPAERAWVNVAQFAALLGVHEAWKHHNRRVSAELTASVMGDSREEN